MAAKRAHILLIEDDEIDRELVRRLIGQTYTIDEAGNGTAGLAAIQKKRPDLILLDYRLPDIDSFDLLDDSVATDLPVIVLTGEESPETIIQAMQKGAQDYLLKGQLSAVRLERAIGNALEKARLQRDVTAQQQQLAHQSAILTEQNSQIRTLASALTLAEQRERKRIARLLHDHLQQLLYGAQMRVHLLAEDLTGEKDEQYVQNLAEATRLIEQAIAATRSLAIELSPPVLKHESVEVVLQWLATHMHAIHGLHVELQIAPDLDYQIENEEVRVLIFQLVRELLFNVVKHANVKEARVCMFMEDGAHRIAVEDEGVGFEMNKIVQPKWQPNQGYGLYSVRERLALFGGRLEVDAHPGNGARVTIILPATFMAGVADSVHKEMLADGSPPRS